MTKQDLVKELIDWEYQIDAFLPLSHMASFVDEINNDTNKQFNFWLQVCTDNDGDYMYVYAITHDMRIFNTDVQSQSFENLEEVADVLLELEEKSKKNPSIRIPLTEGDLHDLQGEGTFDWTFDNVDVHLFKALGNCDHCSEDMEREEGLCNDCIPL
jgi:hypothetical protein